jgi:hypothetical protein
LIAEALYCLVENIMGKPNTRSVSKHPRPLSKVSISEADQQTQRPAGSSQPPLADLPLTRKLVWAYDTSSPEFRRIWEQESEGLRRSGSDPDIEIFIQDAQNDPEALKWWR